MQIFLGSLGYGDWILHALLWLPLVGVGLILWGSEERAKGLAFACSAGVFVLSLGVRSGGGGVPAG